MFQATTTLQKIASLSKRLRIIQGGSSAGKTIAILLLLINEAQSKKNILISVVSESFPHLRRGAIKDFLLIMQEHGYFKDDLWNKTESTYTFETGSKIEFFSADTPSKVKGPRRDILFLNEANAISYETYTQLAIRTNQFIFIDYNPTAEFFVHTEILPKNNDHDFIIVTYRDNQALPETIVKEIESRKDNKNFWRVYGEGQLGEVEGRIYSNWAIIDSIPHEARLERYGLDFGYTNDPTALIGLYKHNGGYIVDEIMYLKGQSNKQIADTLLNLPRALVIADSAEPKSIAEIRSYGINILPCQKGQGSINQGIQYVQDQKISVTKQSINTIKEYRNYLWLTDKDGKIINEPDPRCENHALDGIRYSLDSFKQSHDGPIVKRNFNFAGHITY